MSKRISATIDDSLKSCIEADSNEWNTSEAEVIRQALKYAYRPESDFETEVGDHYIENLEFEKMTEEHRPMQRMKWFPKNVKEEFIDDFEEGLGEWSMSITRDYLLDELERTDCIDEERKNVFRQHVWNWYKKAIKLQEKSNRDPLDPEVLEEYSGIEEAEQKEQAKAKLSDHVERAVDLLTDKKGSLRGSSARDPEQVEKMLRNRSSLPDALAEEAVGEALTKVSKLPMEVIEQVNDGEADLSEISVEEHSTETETSQPQTEPEPETEPETEQHVDGDLDGSDHSEEEADHSEEEEQLPETAVSKAVEMMRSGSSTAEVYKTVRKYVVSDSVGEAVIEEARRRVEQPEASVETGAGDRAATDGGGDR